MLAKQLSSLMMFSFLSASALADTAQNWVIKPELNVGEITKNSSEQDLIKIYGKKNIKRTEIDVGEGEVVLGTILFPETKKQITIKWKEGFSKPDRITVAHINSTWRLNNGIKIGSTLEEVERLNKGPFKLTGFEWDYPGRTVSWEKGKLPAQIQLDFEYTADIPQEEFIQVLGDRNLSSKNRFIRKMNLKVKTIFIRWDILQNTQAD
jgi:hypothetical protein